MPIWWRSLKLALIASALSGQAALASFTVGELAVSSTPDLSGSTATFPVGTETVYVVYRYSGAQGEKIQINVEMNNLPELYQSAARTYRGDGSDSVPIRGIDIYRSLASRVDDHLTAIGDVLLLIENQTLVHDYFLQIKASANATISAAEIVAGFKDSLPSALLSDADQLRRAMTDVGSLADEALQLPQSDLEGKRAVAARIRTLAQAAAANAANIGSHAASATRMPLPATASAVDGFTVQVLKDGGLHRDTAFGVSGSGSPAAGAAVGGATATAGSGNAPAATATLAGLPTQPGTSSRDNTGAGAATGGSAMADRQATVLATTLAATPGGSRPLSVGTTAPSGIAPAVTSSGTPVSAPLGSGPGNADGGGGATPAPTEAQAVWGSPGAVAPLAPGDAGVAPGEATPEGIGGPPAERRGPNLAVLALGVVALAGAAFWLRQRV